MLTVSAGNKWRFIIVDPLFIQGCEEVDPRTGILLNIWVL